MWLPIGFTLIVLLALLLAAGGAFLALRWGWPAVLKAVVSHMEPALREHTTRIDAIETAVEAIPASFEAYQKEVKRIHDRAYVVVRRARKELAESNVEQPELEQLATGLQLFDGAGGADGEVSQVPEALAPYAAPVEASTPLTWRQLTFRRKHGLG